MFGLLLPDPDRNRAARKSWDRIVVDVITASTDVSLLVKSIVDSLSEELLEIIRPYITQLVGIAKGLSLDPEQYDDSSWCCVFQDELCKIMETALHLKIMLTKSDSEHSFVWPCNGEALDTSRMKPLNRPGLDQEHEVAYTLFPSLETEGRLGLRKVRHAEVVSLPASVRRGSSS